MQHGHYIHERDANYDGESDESREGDVSASHSLNFPFCCLLLNYHS